MAKIKFTDAWIKAKVKNPPGKRTDYFSASYPGLCLTVGPRSATWYYFTRVDGKVTRLKLGQYGRPDAPAMRYTDAAKAADRIEEAKEQGEHPKAVQARQRTEKRQAREIDHARLIENVAEAWQEHHLPDVKPQTRAMYRRAVGRIVERFEGRDISTISRGELVRLLDRVKARTKSGSNHLAATMRLLFGYAFDRLELENNPAAGLKNPARMKSRDRILDRRELRIVWKACELAGYPHGHALRFQICTGQRIGEVGGIRRNDIADGYWKLSRTKTGKRIDVFLAGHASAILADCPDFGDRAPFFSAAEVDGEMNPLPPDGFHNALARHVRPRLEQAAEEVGLPPIEEHWTPHDLRRTVRSGLTGWCGIFPDIAERTINHAIGGIRAVYDHADYRLHVAEALKAWDAELGRILAGKQATVTPIKREAV